MFSLFDLDDAHRARGARRALVLNYAGRAVEMSAFLLTTLVLARLLTPRDFGIFAMVSPFVWVAMQFGDLGLGPALLGERRLDRERASAFFALNLAAGAALGLLFIAVSPLVGRLYGDPEAGHAAAMLSGLFLVSGLSAVQIALLRRARLFGPLFCAQVAAGVASLVVALALAWSGAGYWALVGRAVAEPLVLGAVAWCLAPWRPARPRFTPETGRLLRVGGWFAAGSTLNASGRQIDGVLIGWRYASAELGQYALAYRLFYLPVVLVSWPLGHVAVPTLSRLRDEPDAFVAWFTDALRWMSLGAFPLFLGLSVCASDVVALVAGPQWVFAGTILQVLAPVGAVQVAAAAAEWLLQAHGRSDRAFRWSLGANAAWLAGAAGGLPWGATGVACGLAAAHLALLLPGFAYAVGGTPVRMRHVGAALLPACLVGVAVALAVHLVRAGMLGAWSPGARLLVCACLGGAMTGVAILWVLHGRSRSGAWSFDRARVRTLVSRALAGRAQAASPRPADGL